MIDLEGVGGKIYSTVKTKEWKNLQEGFNENSQIILLAHGGNLAIAQHCATQIKRHTGKQVFVPDANYVSIWHGEANYDQWLTEWVDGIVKNQSTESNFIMLGLSASGKFNDVVIALHENSDYMDAHIISSRPLQNKMSTDINQVILNLSHYYTSEVAFMLLCYELIRGYGGVTEAIKSIPSIDSSTVIPREHSISDEKTNLGIDFDGVVHKCSKGFFNGTIYDEPIKGSLKAIKELSKTYTLIMHTAKAKPDRPLIDGKTGTELVWEWLEKYDIARYVKEVTSEKPRAVAYIDDKAIRFSSWEQALKDLEEVS